MLSEIIAAENHLNELLPKERLQHGVPTDLLDAAKQWSATVWAQAEQLGPMPMGEKQINQGLQLAQNPVFICGVHRSGTTLLRDILDGHPDLVVLPSEGTYFTNIESQLLQLPQHEWVGFISREWLRRLANPINQAPYWLLGRSSDIQSPYVDFARYILTWWNLITHKPGTQWPHTAIILAYAACTGNLAARYWVDKTPTNERFLNRILQEMPRARIIHIIREPAATLASRKQMEPGITLHNALGHLKSSFLIAARMKESNSSNYLLLRYEDLCNDNPTSIQQITQFLGITVSPSLNAPSQGGRPSRANSSFSNEVKSGIILKPDAHRHKDVLSHKEQQLIAAVVGKLAHKHHYQFKPIGFAKRAYLQLRYRLKITSKL